jgi:D-serine deaminase-like pyridoxal phosphate-dependent protein
MFVTDLPTPAAVVDLDVLERNLARMAAWLPGPRLRPHVKAHKCTGLAGRQVAHGHEHFTCATPREVVGMAAAGVGTDLLLANETVDVDRLRAMAAHQDDVLVTVAIDSEATLDAAARAGIRHVLVDVNVGLPRCGVAPERAGSLADAARRRGRTVRGVMGYEGHLMMVTDRSEQRARVEAAMALLLRAHEDVGGEVVSAGGTGTYDLHDRATEVQAGSYALMDTAYATLGLPFEQALAVVGTVISVNERWVVADVGLKALGMDHGNPAVEGASVWFCSDEHVTFAAVPPEGGAAPSAWRVGDRVRVWPAHVDPTLALHDRIWLVRGEEVVDAWAVDLRGW